MPFSGDVLIVGGLHIQPEMRWNLQDLLEGDGHVWGNGALAV